MYKIFYYIVTDNNFPKLDWLDRNTFIKFCYHQYMKINQYNKSYSFLDFYFGHLILLKIQPEGYKKIIEIYLKNYDKQL